jgi:hypothetical protein
MKQLSLRVASGEWLVASETIEDCLVVPPRNDGFFTLTPLVKAWGNNTSCHRERSEAIFNGSSSRRYWQRPIQIFTAGSIQESKALELAQTKHLSQGRF